MFLEILSRSRDFEFRSALLSALAHQAHRYVSQEEHTRLILLHKPLSITDFQLPKISPIDFRPDQRVKFSEPIKFLITQTRRKSHENHVKRQ